jgi:hypothetical protein
MVLNEPARLFQAASEVDFLRRLNRKSEVLGGA